MKNFLTTIALLASAGAFSGCGLGSAQEVAAPLSISPQAAAVGVGQSVQFTTTNPGGYSVRWLVNGISEGNADWGVIDSDGRYTAPMNSNAKTVFVTAQSIGHDASSAVASVHVIEFDAPVSTGNPQVARYRIGVPLLASATVQFGTDTNYGLQTSPQYSDLDDGAITVLVAGMRAFTDYHMRAIVQMADGTQLVDGDHVFTTGGLQGSDLPNVTVKQTFGLTPQPGIEIVNGVLSPAVPIYATDLSGNVIWWYKFTDGSVADTVNPIRFMPNGHWLVSIGPASSSPLHGPIPPGTISVIREIDLAGTTIRELTIDQLNARMAAAGKAINGLAMHHDVLPLDNGHWILIVSGFKHYDDVTGLGSTDVLGDYIIDMDENLNPVWVWSSFDHLDVNRHPLNFPDWTHTNALVYAPEDGNLLISVRHQSWILKLDYKDGTGSGDVLWRLGKDGDFTLVGGIDPTDWFYAQHGPAIVKSKGHGLFSLSVMDNGNDRVFPAGQTCAGVGLTPCPYSTAGIYEIDENMKTATLTLHYNPAAFSVFGGLTTPLPNGNFEFDFCAINLIPLRAVIYEITQDASPQVVWQMDIENQAAYRAFRQPSLYPGVQW